LAAHKLSFYFWKLTIAVCKSVRTGRWGIAFTQGVHPLNPVLSLLPIAIKV
jgi:hypothetical protein